MKLFFLFSLLLCIGPVAFSQDHWKVTVNGKTVLTGSGEGEAENIVPLRAATLKKKKDFLVHFTPEGKKQGWERYFAVFYQNDRELMRQKGNPLKLKNATVQTLLKASDTLRVFTWALPTDPKLKAAIRVRRVHLCTLVLQ